MPKIVEAKLAEESGPEMSTCTRCQTGGTVATTAAMIAGLLCRHAAAQVHCLREFRLAAASILALPWRSSRSIGVMPSLRDTTKTRKESETRDFQAVKDAGRT